MTIPRPAIWAILGSLGVLAIVALPDLGSNAWPFAPTDVEPRGVLGPLVRAADEEWDPDVPRTAAMIAALIVALAGAVAWRADRWRRGWAVALCAVVVALLVVPAVLLQVGLRDATAPWYHVNDSTYQIDIAGDLVLDGENPYGHDYRDTGLERWYPAAGEGGRRQVALDHFAYFPGTVLTATAWRLLPAPFDDYRLLVLLATLALLPAALLFPAPSSGGSWPARRWRQTRSRSRRRGSGQPTRRASSASSSPSRSPYALAGSGPRSCSAQRCCSSSSPSWRCRSWP